MCPQQTANLCQQRFPFLVSKFVREKNFSLMYWIWCISIYGCLLCDVIFYVLNKQHIWVNGNQMKVLKICAELYFFNLIYCLNIGRTYMNHLQLAVKGSTYNYSFISEVLKEWRQKSIGRRYIIKTRENIDYAMSFVVTSMRRLKNKITDVFLQLKVIRSMKKFDILFLFSILIRFSSALV